MTVYSLNYRPTGPATSQAAAVNHRRRDLSRNWVLGAAVELNVFTDSDLAELVQARGYGLERSVVARRRKDLVDLGLVRPCVGGYGQQTRIGKTNRPLLLWETTDGAAEAAWLTGNVTRDHQGTQSTFEGPENILAHSNGLWATAEGGRVLPSDMPEAVRHQLHDHLMLNVEHYYEAWLNSLIVAQHAGGSTELGSAAGWMATLLLNQPASQKRAAAEEWVQTRAVWQDLMYGDVRDTLEALNDEE